MTQYDRKRLERDLKPQIRGDLRTDVFWRAMYSTDASIYQIEPLAVVVPRDVADVVAVVRYAAEHGIPIHPRGAGSGLAGESLGPGIVLDTTKYMRAIESIDAEEGRCVLQPGVVLDQLNSAVSATGWQFGPDPSSGARCTLGGMIANNATGAHSLIYGYTRDYIESLDVVFADGTSATLTATDWKCVSGNSAPSGVPGQALRELPGLLERYHDMILARTPRCARNRAGYVLNGILENGTFHPHRLIAGSEGTLAIVTRAHLWLVRRPTRRCVVLLNFSTIDRAAQCVPLLLQTDPSAIELLDGFVVQSARETGRKYGDLLDADTAAVLIVEFYGDTEPQLRTRAEETIYLATERLRLAQSGRAAFAGEEIDLIWSLRKAAEPLLYRSRGPRQSVAFIEDAAVSAEVLPEYLRRLDEILRREEVTYATFGHAAHGELHTRPFLNLRREEDIERMERIADQVCDLVLSLGGTISGEHGDGLARVQFIPRQYGPLMEAFRQIKALFDPQGILNPGKILNDDPHAIRHHLRYGKAYEWRAKPAPMLVWHDDEMQWETEKCNGCGECRSLGQGVTMCPVFRATLDEEASPRAKANLMRLFMTGQIDLEWLYSEEFKAIADLCVNCKMCHLECPSQVNIPKLMLEAKAQWAARHGQPIVNQVLIRSELLARLGSMTAPLANLSLRLSAFRFFMEWLTGIDRRRLLPPFAARPFLSRHPGSSDVPASRTRRVAYFVDLFANYNDPDLGQAVVDVLQHNGVETIVPKGQKGCAMPQIDYGAVRQALPQIRYNIDMLAEVIREGYTVVCSEPTATLCLKEEYLDYVDTENAHRVAQNTRDVCDLLLELDQGGEMLTSFARDVPVRFGYHAPCHLKALNVGRPGMALVQRIPGATVTYIDAGCCGIAGTFGMKAKTFDLSMQAGRMLFEGLKTEGIVYGLTECSTCKMQMEQGSGKPALHPVKVLAYAYGALDELPGMTVLPQQRSYQPPGPPR